MRKQTRIGKREREARKRYGRGRVSSSASTGEWLKLGHKKMSIHLGCFLRDGGRC